MKITDHGDGRLHLATGAEVPLKIADPEDEVGDDGGAWVEFDTEQLVGIDSEAGVLKNFLGLAERVEGFEDLTLEPLHVLERDVEEIAAAAGGVEDAGVAKLVVELGGGVDGSVLIAGREPLRDDSLDAAPIVAQRFHESGKNEALDVGAWSVMRSEGTALVGIQSTLQQSAEDCWLDVAPAGVGGLEQEQHLVWSQWQGFGRFKEAAVELQNVFTEDGREAAVVHGLPKGFDEAREVVEVGGQACEQIAPCALREQANIFGERGKNAAGKEFGDFFGRVVVFQVARQPGQFLGNFSGDLRTLTRWVERMRIEPGGAKAVADFRFLQFIESDSIIPRPREREIGFAGEREIGEELDGMAYVDDDEKRGQPSEAGRALAYRSA